VCYCLAAPRHRSSLEWGMNLNKDNEDICFKRQLGKIAKTTGNDK